MTKNKKFHGPYEWVILSQLSKTLQLGITKKRKLSFYPLIEKKKMKGCFFDGWNKRAVVSRLWKQELLQTKILLG